MVKSIGTINSKPEHDTRNLGGAVGGALLAIVFPVRGERKIYTPGQRGLATLAFITLSALLLFIGLL